MGEILPFNKNRIKKLLKYTHIADYSCIHDNTKIIAPFPAGLNSTCPTCLQQSLRLVDGTVRELPPERK